MANLAGAAGDIVERARLGDQVAMAIIAEVGKRRKNGVAAAVAGFNAIQSYIKANPPKTTEATMGAETIEALKVLDRYLHDPQRCMILILRLPIGGTKGIELGSLALANGPKLGNERIRRMGAFFGEPEERRVFFCGIGAPHALRDALTVCRNDHVPILHAAGCVALARRIQRVREPNASISEYSPVIGWELGEGPFIYGRMARPPASARVPLNRNRPIPMGPGFRLSTGQRYIDPNRPDEGGQDQALDIDDGDMGEDFGAARRGHFRQHAHPKHHGSGVQRQRPQRHHEAESPPVENPPPSIQTPQVLPPQPVDQVTQDSLAMLRKGEGLGPMPGMLSPQNVPSQVQPQGPNPFTFGPAVLNFGPQE